MELSVIKISATVTAYQRVDQTLATIRVLFGCRPTPSEIIVHIDGNQTECATAIREAFPAVRTICSTENVGPGGGRNKMIAEAMCPIIASFDDDSYPIDPDYFGRLNVLFSKHPDASILCAKITHKGESVAPADFTGRWTADFTGGACAYRRDAFLKTGGYLPLPFAYGMEESDLAIRLHAQGGKILFSPWLRVYHDTDLSRHADASVTTSSICNIALLAFLRYPLLLWPVGLFQVLNRIGWLVRHGRRAGIVRGILRIPRHLLRHRSSRKAIPSESVRSYLSLRRNPSSLIEFDCGIPGQ